MVLGTSSVGRFREYTRRRCPNFPSPQVRWKLLPVGLRGNLVSNPPVQQANRTLLDHYLSLPVVTSMYNEKFRFRLKLRAKFPFWYRLFCVSGILEKLGTFVSCRLLSACELPAHPRFYPLSFVATRGIERQDTHSTAFYNIAEVGTVPLVYGNVTWRWKCFPALMWPVIRQTCSILAWCLLIGRFSSKH